MVACKKGLEIAIDSSNFNPLLLRLAWSDAVTYDSSLGNRHWPFCGGCNGSIRFDDEIQRKENAGLNKAINFLSPFHAKYKRISWLVSTHKRQMDNKINFYTL